ncbi:hemerythrin domain-containing protein [Bacillus taeanensis]|uniref:Hemerythrin domain-containing protein n=2 Tax=Bacillus taeanensis TaxID=273032 RepID=A0A366XW83_9BACI|nr:hemerythrin domain-containing protein [Bacillus taeanensis]
MMRNTNVVFCSALEQLKKEHIPLTKQMEEFYELTQEIENDGAAANIENIMNELHEKIKAFVSELEPHSEREEGVLFPMMVPYIGRESGPIAVMEYEHDEAKKQLKHFLAQMEKAERALTMKKAKELANFASQAYLILSEHFMKEENVLFPLANRLLSIEEKEELQSKINAI